MAINVGALYASLTLQSNQFTRGLRDATHAAHQAESGIGSAFAGIGKHALGVFGGLELVEMAKEFAHFAKEVIDQAADLGELAKKTGTTVEQYQVLRRVAISTGMSMETMDKGLGKLNKTLGDARRGSSAALAAFKAIGISKEQIANLHTAGDAYTVVIDRLHGVAGSADQASKAQKFFGKAYADQMPVIAEGRKLIDEQTKALEENGFITEAQAEKAHDAKVAIELLADSLKTKLAVALLDNLPAIQSVINGLSDLINEAATAIKWLDALPAKREAASAQMTLGFDVFSRNVAAGAGFMAPGVAAAKNRAEIEATRAQIAGINAREAARIASLNAHPHETPQIHIPTAQDLAGKGGHAAHAKASKDLDKAAKDLIADLKFEDDQLTRTSEQQEFYNNLKHAGVTATSAFGIEIGQLTQKLHDDKAWKDYTEAVNETVQSIENADRLIGMTDRDAAVEQARQDFLKLRKKAFGDAGGDPTSITVTSIERDPDWLRIKQATLAQQGHKEAVEQTTAAQEKMNNVIKDGLERERARWEAAQQEAEAFGREVGTIGTTFIADLMDGQKTFAQAFGDTVKSLGQLIIQEFVFKPIQEFMAQWAKAQLTNLFAKIIGSAGGGGGGGLGEIVGMVVKSAVSAGTGAPKGFAAGGNVPGGNPIWVGERGPELFVPNVNGRIVANDNFRGGGPVFNIDARGSTNPAETQRMIMDGLAMAMPTIVSAATDHTLKKLSRPRM